MCVPVCEHSHGRTVWPMTLIFGMVIMYACLVKGKYMRVTPEVCERSGIFIVYTSSWKSTDQGNKLCPMRVTKSFMVVGVWEKKADHMHLETNGSEILEQCMLAGFI